MIAAGRTESWQRALRLHWPWLLLLLLTVFLHLYALDERSFHHDESIHAKLSYDLAERGSYHYDPTYHGPLLYFLTALAYHALGDSDFVARLPIALAGIGMLWVAWRLRRPFGGRAAWVTGLLFTISPMFLFFGRFQRMDLLEVVTASGALLAWYSVLRGEPRAWIHLGVWTGLAFATKENAYVTVALIGATSALLAVDRGIRTSVPAAVSWLVERWVGVSASLATFVLVTVPMYTVGFTRPEDWFFPFRAISYWWSQHTIQRVGGPWWFHLPRLAQYEIVILVAATVWIVRRWKRLRQIELFLYIMGVTSIVMYIYLGEKVPWLGVHQVWPFIPLAGAQLARSLGPRGRWWSRSLAVAGLVFTAGVSYTANFVLQEISPAQRRVESLHFVQTTPELAGVAREGLALTSGDGSTVACVSGEAVWPLTWYWRDLPTWWALPKAGLRPALVVCDSADELEVKIALGPGYSRERVPLRAWWLMYEGKPTVLEALRYGFARVPWSVVGSTDVLVFRRTSDDAPASRPADVPVALSEALEVVSAEIAAEGWQGEVRGVAAAGGRVAVADASLSRITVIDVDDSVVEVPVDVQLNQPEAVAWHPDLRVLIADTWGHRVLGVDTASGESETLPAPEGGWYGPRALAVGPHGRVVVADTGHKRLVVYDSMLEISHIVEVLTPHDTLDEPGGVAWVDQDSVLVCDTGNHRLLVVGLDGSVESEVRMPDAWDDYYSRPQVAIIAEDRWVVSDTPAGALWLVSEGRATRLDLDGEMQPTGVAWQDGVLVVGDLDGKVWRLEVDDGSS